MCSCDIHCGLDRSIFIAFLTAFGNDSPMARAILKGFELFTIIANPVWGIPIAFLIGIYTKRK
jgi:hypothetical protein